MSTSNVYLLVFPKVNAVKIGKADDLSARIGTLERSWGKPDYSASWRFPVPAGIVFLDVHPQTSGRGSGKRLETLKEF